LSFRVFGLMDANASSFNDPQLLVERHGFESVQELPDQLFEQQRSSIRATILFDFQDQR